MDDAGVGVVDDVAEIDAPRARLREQRRVVGHVALDMPARRDRGARLLRRAEVNVRAAEPDLRGAIELAPGGHVEIDAQHDFLPRPGTIVRRREIERLRIEADEREFIEQRNDAGLGRRRRNVGIGDGDVLRADRRQLRERERTCDERGQQRRTARGCACRAWRISLSSGIASLAPGNAWCAALEQAATTATRQLRPLASGSCASVQAARPPSSQ